MHGEPKHVKEIEADGGVVAGITREPEKEAEEDDDRRVHHQSEKDDERRVQPDEQIRKSEDPGVISQSETELTSKDPISQPSLCTTGTPTKRLPELVHSPESLPPPLPGSTTFSDLSVSELKAIAMGKNLDLSDYTEKRDMVAVMREMGIGDKEEVLLCLASENTSQ